MPDIIDDIASACRVDWRGPLPAEVARLDRMHNYAHARPLAWAEATAGRQCGLGLWLFGVACGVAAQGLPEAAIALLDVLPGIDASSGGRRELLAELCASRNPAPVQP